MWIEKKHPQYRQGFGANEFWSSPFQKETIVIIGTGDLGQGLAKCLTRRGYRVVVASRNPEKNRRRVEAAGGEIENYDNAIRQGGIVIVAIPCNGFVSLPVDLLVGKIVIDASNRPMDYNRVEPSMAYQLQILLPGSKVVKAFNTLSAYGLSNNIFQGSKEVPVCSDYEEAKYSVMELVRNLGFMPVNRGTLSSAAEIENITMAFFPEWKIAFILAASVFSFAFGIILFRTQLCPNFQLQGNVTWNLFLFDNLMVDNFQSTFGLASITCLWACYLPGVIAAFIQLSRGTKYSEFPKWLDSWLRSRKNIGIITLLFAAMHVLMAVLTVVEYGIQKEWTNFTYLGFGCFAIGLMTILGIISLPSVSQSLSWREFSFVQRYLGWWALTCAVLHVLFARWEGLTSDGQQCVVIPDEVQIFIILPLITVLLKLVLLLPFINSQLKDIRKGIDLTPIQ